MLSVCSVYVECLCVYVECVCVYECVYVCAKVQMSVASNPAISTMFARSHSSFVHTISPKGRSGPARTVFLQIYTDRGPFVKVMNSPDTLHLHAHGLQLALLVLV